MLAFDCKKNGNFTLTGQMYLIYIIITLLKLRLQHKLVEREEHRYKFCRSLNSGARVKCESAHKFV